MSDLLYVNSLVARALKTVRALSNKQSANESDKQDTLSLLNEILSEMSGDAALLPFQVMISFNTIVGQKTYSVGNIAGVDVTTTPFATIEYVNLIIDGIRFAVDIQDDFALLGHDVNLENESRPGWVRITRGNDVSLLEFYNTPDQVYVCEIWGKKESSAVDFQDYIQLPNWYARYLRLALAREVNDYFDLKAWDKAQEDRFLEAEAKMLASAQSDWSIKSDPPFVPGIGVRTYRLGVITK